MDSMNTFDYTVETVETLEGLKEIQNDWERLVSLKKEIPVFFSFEVFMIYYETILKSFDNVKIEIFVVRNKNQKIVAIFPFTYELKILSSFLPFKELAIKDEYLIGFYYFLIDPGENLEAILQKFLKYLKEIKKRWDIIKVYTIPEDESLVKVFTLIFGKSYKIDEGVTNTLIIDCDREFNDYIKNDMGGKVAHEWKKKHRRLERKGIVKFVEMSEQQEIEKGLPYFYDIEDSGWKGKEGTSLKRSYYGEYYKELAIHLSKENKFRLYFLQVNNEYIAGIYAIIDREIFYMVKIGYSDEFAQYSPSTVLFFLIFEYLFTEKKIKKIDFYGPYLHYQRIFGKHTRKTYNIIICNRKFLPIMYYIVLKALRKFGYPFQEGSLQEKIFTALTKCFYMGSNR
jgi:hypothetical protein